jgi:cell division protein FtsW
LGFIGVFIIAALFMILIIKCLKLALRVQDRFGLYLVVGITVMIGLQAFINMLVVMGLLPTKGLTLPFLSYGGSSLLLNMICVGILMNLTAQHHGEKECAS